METVLMDKNHIFTDNRSLKMPEGFISSDEYEEKLAEEEQATIQEKAREMYTELKLEQLRRPKLFRNKDIKTISQQFRA